MRADGSSAPDYPPSVDTATDATQSDRVVTVAAEVFAERGLGATLAEIAERTGVGVASVYRRFASKDDLISKVYEPRLFAAKRPSRTLSTTPTHGRPSRATSATAFVRWSKTRVSASSPSALTPGPSDGRAAVHPTGCSTWWRGSSRDGPHHINLVLRAQASGELRKDLHPTDMLVLTMAALSTADFAGGAFPGLPERVATVILDGLRRREGATPLPASPVSDEELHAFRSGKPPTQ